MSEKVGRNDPCPCGSGKKYKNCHYGKEAKKTYTPEGKRKFTAKLLSGSAKGQSVFQQLATPPMPSASEPLENLRFNETKEQYMDSVKEEGDTEPAYERDPSSPNPTPLEGDPEQPPEVFEITEENYEKKD